MDTNDSRSVGAQSRPQRTASAVARGARRMIDLTLQTLRDWFKGWGRSTQLGPVPEQVIARRTGART